MAARMGPEYRQIRLTINPGRNVTTVALVARRHTAGRNVDGILYRGELDSRVPYPSQCDILDLLEQAVKQVRDRA